MAAGSTGQEAYSVAMLLEDCLPGQPWEVVASDISTRVLERARTGGRAGVESSQAGRPVAMGGGDKCCRLQPHCRMLDGAAVPIHLLKPAF